MAAFLTFGNTFMAHLFLASGMGVIGLLLLVYPVLFVVALLGIWLSTTRIHLAANIPGGVLFAYVLLRIAEGTLRDGSENGGIELSLAILSSVAAGIASGLIAWRASRDPEAVCGDHAQKEQNGWKRFLVLGASIQVIVGGILVLACFKR